MKNMNNGRVILLAVLLWMPPVLMAQAPARKKSTIELKAIEVRGRLQEPTLIYILDQPELEIDPYRDDAVDFLDKIAEPIVENTLVPPSE